MTLEERSAMLLVLIYTDNYHEFMYAYKELTGKKSGSAIWFYLHKDEPGYVKHGGRKPKLTQQQIDRIFEVYANPDLHISQEALAKEFGVTRKTIQRTLEGYVHKGGRQ